MIKGVEIIAEVKTKSPFGFKSNRTWEELFKIAESAGDIIAVHTDPRWGGSFNLIKRARKLTSKPILAKGIHPTDEDVAKAIDKGADYVLVVGRVPKVFQEKCFIEPLNLEELSKLPKELKIVWNLRDLSNGELKKETFEQARMIWKGWLCQASFIKSVKDIKDGANAVIVGTRLEEFAESIKT